MLLSGLFLLCGLVNADMKAKVDETIRLYQIKQVGNDNLPRLNCSIDSLLMGCDDAYEIYWNVKAYCANAKQMKSILKTEKMKDQQNVDLVTQIKDGLAVSSDEANNVVASGLENLVLDYEFQGSSLIKYAKRSTLVFEKWPETTNGAYVYIINYKIWQWANLSKKVDLANFTVKMCCFLNPATKGKLVQIFTGDDENGEPGKYNSEILDKLEFLPETTNAPINSFLIKLHKKGVLPPDQSSSENRGRQVIPLPPHRQSK